MRTTILLRSILFAVVAFGLGAGPAASAQASSSFVSATTVPQASLLQPEELAKTLAAGDAEKPLILQVGSRLMYSQAHIPGSEYAGPGSQVSGIQSLESTVSGLSKDHHIVLYCGCCPWDRCPNIGPAYKRLHDLGFANVKVLYLAHNFGDDWVSKGYPSIKGK